MGGNTDNIDTVFHQKAVSVLKQYWGYDSFRPRQEEIVRSAYEGRDVLAILPTGGGKSVCFQVPAMMKEGIAIVVTPLVSLMKDQVQNLRSKGIKALCVNAGMGRREVELALNNAVYGDFKFLYLSPERLGTALFRSYLGQMNVNFIVVDEAHCISQWGYDFRPDYLQIGQLRDIVEAPVIAVTATATPEVAEDIMGKLCFRQSVMVKAGFERTNLTYVVRKCEDKLGQMLSVCSAVAGTGIVYVRSRKKTEELAAFLSSNGVSASYYHAGLASETRAQRQAEWKSGTIRVMVCTNAFGMGIDKPDVRFVVHFDVPDSPEAYFQEIGRGGRDGKRSYAVMFWNASDIRRLKQTASVSFPGLEYIEDIYHKVHTFYRIPYDTGAGRQIKFELEEFCRHYKLQRASAYYAVLYIERTGHWTLSEDVDIKARVQISVERSDLYDMEFYDREQEAVLEVLMRKYTGVFDYPVPIDEEYISSCAAVSVPVLRQLLYRLSLEHIIRYIPATHSTVLFLHHDRLRPQNVELDAPRYERLKDAMYRRIDKMIDYVRETDKCRSLFLLEYFGQKDSSACGTCDVCRSHRSVRHKLEENSPNDCSSDEELSKAVTAYVNDEMEGSWNLSEALCRFSPEPASEAEREHFLTLLRTLIADGTIPPFRA